jgi:hypothetical protein
VEGEGEGEGNFLNGNVTMYTNRRKVRWGGHITPNREVDAFIKE